MALKKNPQFSLESFTLISFYTDFQLALVDNDNIVFIR
jgi:hypothetical protein